MTDTAEYITLLVISVAITIAVGRVLSMSGRPFLQEVFEDEKVTSSVNRLLSVLFHLITIGVLTIISVWQIDVGSQLQNIGLGGVGDRLRGGCASSPGPCRRV